MREEAATPCRAARRGRAPVSRSLLNKGGQARHQLAVDAAVGSQPESWTTRSACPPLLIVAPAAGSVQVCWPGWSGAGQCPAAVGVGESEGEQAAEVDRG